MAQEQSGLEPGLESRKATSKPKSHIAYPWYDLAESIKLTELIDSKGGGSMSAQTLAVETRSSVTSGFFQSKLRAARLFGLLSQGADEVWATTERARRVLRPRSPEDKGQALRDAFGDVPLFKAVLDRYAGKPLPGTESLQNILEHDFGVIPSRSGQAARILLASATEASLLRETDGERYLWPTGGQGPLPSPSPTQPREAQAGSGPPVPEQRNGDAPEQEQAVAGALSHLVVELRLTSRDLEKMAPDDIREVFEALGRIEIARRRARP